MKPFQTAGMIFYSIVAFAAISTAFVHLWNIQRDLQQERRLNTAFRNA